MTSNNFSGPLFVVGLPRSGTKLLRDLLNRHPRLGIPEAESHFLPGLIARFGPRPDLAAPERRRAFDRAIGNTTFARAMLSRHGRELPEGVLDAAAAGGDWPAVFGPVFRFYAGLDNREAGFIWGDKSPEYLERIAELKAAFPAARFLHIIRDPRDRALSVRQAWGLNLFRAADRWRRSLEAARPAGRALGRDYHELRFEDLLSAPEPTLRAICGFLEIDFRPAMTRLARPAEAVGDARGRTDIVADNQQKFRTGLTPGELKRVEEIAWPVARALGYAPEAAAGFVAPGPLARARWRLNDALAALRFHVRTKGWRRGLAYACRLHRQMRD